jgi:hypothetical protein
MLIGVLHFRFRESAFASFTRIVKLANGHPRSRILARPSSAALPPAPGALAVGLLGGQPVAEPERAQVACKRRSLPAR